MARLRPTLPKDEDAKTNNQPSDNIDENIGDKKDLDSENVVDDENGNTSDELNNRQEGEDNEGEGSENPEIKEASEGSNSTEPATPSTQTPPKDDEIPKSSPTIKEEAKINPNASTFEKEKMVKIKLRYTHSCCIGGVYYSFTKGQVVNVPKNVRNILNNAGLLDPI